VIFVPIAMRAKGLVPTGARNLFEAVLQFLREEVARPALGKHTDKYIGFIWTMFFLILTANLLGMIPIGAVGASIDSHLKHIGGTATGNISITAGLALCSFFLIHISGMREKGLGKYWNSFFFGHAPMALAPLMIPLEILGALVKPFALAIRLFANMIAGHVVIAVLLGFAAFGIAMGGAYIGITAVSVLGAVFIGLLEVLVAFIQAYIFTFLTTLFVGMAVQSDH
jgi:F-type H+-transporting ATPase subunit a